MIFRGVILRALWIMWISGCGMRGNFLLPSCADVDVDLFILMMLTIMLNGYLEALCGYMRGVVFFRVQIG